MGRGQSVIKCPASFAASDLRMAPLVTQAMSRQSSVRVLGCINICRILLFDNETHLAWSANELKLSL